MLLPLLLLAASGLTPFEAGGLWGYKDAKGAIAIGARFQVAQKFSRHGIAAVADETGWAYIDRTGRVLVRPFLFDNGPDPFHEGLARCVSEGKIGFFDRSGKIVIRPQFDFAKPFSGGRAEVCMGCKEEADGEHKVVRGGRWGVINRRGELVVPLAPR